MLPDMVVTPPVPTPPRGRHCMAKKKKIRIDGREANRLNELLKGKAVVTRSNGEGRVERVSRGGIQVYLLKRKTIHAYPIYQSFVSGEVRLKESVYQEEMLRCLSEVASPTPSKPLPKAEQVTVEPVSPRVSHVDVPGNVRLVCFFKNADVDKYLAHMRRVGLKGFGDSLERGFEEEPFIALRETEYYLGCSTRMLLNGNEEFLRQTLRECSASKEWDWKERIRDRLGDGGPQRSLWCRNIDRKRRFLVRAVCGGGDMRRCTIMMADFFERRHESSEARAMQCAVAEPSQETIDAFDAIFGAAKAVVMGVASPAKTPPAQTPLAKAPKQTPAPSKAVPATTARQGPGNSNAVQPKAILVNEFLVRKSYGTHRANGHSLEPVRATVAILPRVGGDPRPVEFDGYWCPKCRKYFMTEGTYLRLKRQGYICCKVVEEKDLGTRKTGEGLYGKLASESILHMYGYTVNQQDDLSEDERRTIISFVIENRIQTAQDVSRLLEWLIAQRVGNPRMAVAVSRWRSDLAFVRCYHKPMRKVRVDRIYAKI